MPSVSPPLGRFSVPKERKGTILTLSYDDRRDIPVNPATLLEVDIRTGLIFLDQMHIGQATPQTIATVQQLRQRRDAARPI